MTFLGGALPPIGAILLADFFLVHKGKYTPIENMTFQTVRFPAIIAWGAGFGASFLPGIPPLNGIFSAIVIYIGLTWVTERVFSASKEAIVGKEG